MAHGTGHGDGKVRVFLVEDHPTMRNMLRKLIDRTIDFRVVAAVSTAEEALERFDRTDADLYMVDLSLPGMSGDALIARLRQQRPELRALIVSGHERALYEHLAFRAGALGYVMKDDPEEILRAARRAASGERPNP